MSHAICRRRFLGYTAAGASAAWWAGAARVARAAAEAKLSVGIQMYSLRGYDVDTALRHAHDLGFEVIEMYPGQFPINSTDDEIKSRLSQFEGLGLRCLAHGVNRFTKDHDKNRAIFEFAKKAKIRNLSADPDPDSFDSLDKLVAEFDIRIAIHNHGPKHRYNKVTDVLNAIRDHHQLIGACADLGHYIRSGENSVDVIRALKGRLYGVHLKDFAEMTDKTKGVILGQGHLDVAATFAALRAVDFPADGAVSLEYEENPKDPLEDIRQCLAVAKAALKNS